MILKILALAVVVVIVYFLFFKKSRKETVEKNEKQDLKGGEEIMIECKKCGVYTSNKEAIIKDNEFYCSRECAGI